MGSSAGARATTAAATGSAATVAGTMTTGMAGATAATATEPQSGAGYFVRFGFVRAIALRAAASRTSA